MTQPTPRTNQQPAVTARPSHDGAKMHTLDFARDYISHGYAPLPIPADQKGPRLPKWQELRISADQVGNYFKPNCNIGIILGSASNGLVDIDLDCPEALVLASDFLPYTSSIFGRRNRRGSHRLYKVEGECPSKKFINPIDGGMLVELRGDGGLQTVFPPSRHSNDQVEWESNDEPALIEYADLLKAVAELAAQCVIARHGHEAMQNATVREWLGEHRVDNTKLEPPKAGVDNVNHGNRWAETALENECANVRSAVEGSRNDTLNKAAFSLGQLVGGGELSEDMVVSALLDAALSVRLDRKEALATIRSGLEDGAKHPRSRPEKDSYPDNVRIALDGRTSTSGQNCHEVTLAPNGANVEWPEPKPLPDGLLPVLSFELDYLPQSISEWVGDISDRMQCPPDFVGIAAVVAMGAALGRRIGVRPQSQTDWTEVANLWGCIVGRPGAMKSPAMTEALKPLHRLEADARKAHEQEMKAYEADLMLRKIEKEVQAGKARDALKKGLSAEGMIDPEEPEEPKATRYITNDTTYERLGEILADNPNGVLAYRDELISLLKTLDREEYVAARGFYLTAWNGTQGYTFDRVTRGKTHIDAACVSMLGSTQPGRLAEYIGRAKAGGSGDDGMIQRFSLLVWPDQSAEWHEQDRYPLTEPRRKAWETFGSFGSYDPRAFGAAQDEDGIPYFRFDPTALGTFREWRGDLERRLRSGELSPALESHLAKFRKTVPALALLNHVADGGRDAIGEASLLRALAFAEYLETHARRAYAAGSEGETTAAKSILARIRKGDLKDGFTARELWRNKWSGLTDLEQVKAGLYLLVDHHHLASTKKEGSAGGRPTTAFTINPRATA